MDHTDISTTPGRKRGKQSSGTGMLFVALAIMVALVIGGAFLFQHYKKPANSPLGTGNNGLSGPGGGLNGPGGGGLNGPGGGGQVGGGIGTVTAVSDTSITIKDGRSGETKTFTVSSSTTITNNGASASISDIKTGDTVGIQTSGASSTAAVQIILNPQTGTITPPSSSQ